MRSATPPKKQRKPKPKPVDPAKAKQLAEQLRTDLAGALESGKVLRDYLACMPDPERAPMARLASKLIDAIQKARSPELQMRGVQRRIQFQLQNS